MFHPYFRKKLLGFALAGVAVYAVAAQEPFLMKYQVESKVAGFLGDKMSVDIGGIRGGVIHDMVLRDVRFSARKDKENEVFGLEKMEISYRLWRVVLERLGLLSEDEQELKYVNVYFSDSNPFVRGDIKLERRRNEVELNGEISPVVFGDRTKRSMKGLFTRREDGRYDCDMLWDGSMKVTGTLDPSGRALELEFLPLKGKKGHVKIKAAIEEGNDVKVYARLDKVGIYGTEIIGDVWISYKDAGMPLFLARAENLVINKRPFWKVVIGGGFSPEKKILHLDNVKWGEGLTLIGEVKTVEPYPARLKVLLKDLELAELAQMLGDNQTVIFGKAEGEINFEGPIEEADVQGRLYIGQGVLGPMEFKSVSASLKGRLPVIGVEGSRVVKDGGCILISGEMDFSRMKDNKVFEGVVFDTDNKVAVWEDWQITKEEDEHQVKARRDRLTIITNMQDDKRRQKAVDERSDQQELGMEYELDKEGNHLKFQLDEDDDFLGLEHKMEF